MFALRIVLFYFYRRPPFRLLVVSLNSSQHRYKDELIETAKYIAAPGKGILASDESSGLFFVLISELDLLRAALSVIRIHLYLHFFPKSKHMLNFMIDRSTGPKPTS